MQTSLLLLLLFLTCHIASQTDTDKVAICLEFGTSGSAIASQWRDKFTLFNMWPQKDGNYFKVPSIIKQDEQGYKKFGFEALRQTEAKADTLFNIKMELRKGAKMDEEKTIERIGDYLKYVHDSSVPRMKEKYIHLTSEAQVQWIATIPAIWTEHESDKMRRALAKAGLPVHDPSRFLFIREPEAAAVSAVVNYKGVFHEPVTFLVIDAGAGTIDITVFTFDPVSRTFTEICVPMGNAWGSSTLDDEFFNQMEKAYGKAFMDDLKKTNEYARLRIRWIELKHGTSLETLDDKVFITIVDKSPFEKHNIKVGSNGLQFPFTYRDVYNPVLKHVEELMREVNKKVLKENQITFVFHVGGFALSDAYRKTVDDLLNQFMPNIKIYSEIHEAQSVIHGCTEYALMLQKYQFKRIMKYTYGYEVVSFNTSLNHPVNCRIDGTGRAVCYHTFSPISYAGELIPQGTMRNFSGAPHYRGQTEVAITLYKSTNPNIEFTTDSDAKRLGSLDVKLNEPATETSALHMTFYFGADIFVRVVDEKHRFLGEAAIHYV